MQRVTLVRYTAKPEQAAENETLARAVFAELQAKAPARVAYALFKDGLEFLHLFVNLEKDDSSPVTLAGTVPFGANGIMKWYARPPFFVFARLMPSKLTLAICFPASVSFFPQVSNGA